MPKWKRNVSIVIGVIIIIAAVSLVIGDAKDEHFKHYSQTMLNGPVTISFEEPCWLAEANDTSNVVYQLWTVGPIAEKDNKTYIGTWMTRPDGSCTYRVFVAESFSAGDCKKPIGGWLASSFDCNKVNEYFAGEMKKAGVE